MFRKPKNKNALRQRTNAWDDTEEQTKAQESATVSNNVDIGDVDEVPVGSQKPPALLSFDHDEGADSQIVLKKSKQRVKELKRQAKLEKEAVLEADEKKQREKEDETTLVRQDEFELESDARNERLRYLDRYKREDVQVQRLDELDLNELVDLEGKQDVHAKFAASLSNIPDSRAVYEAKKQRERLRREGGDGYIALDDDYKLREKGVHERLVRDDDNDASDDDEAGRFYSSKSLLRAEEERRREEQSELLNHEQGDGGHDEETAEWEKQQILKAVSRSTIGQLRSEYEQSAQYYSRHSETIQLEEDMDLDINVDQMVSSHQSKPRDPISTGVVTMNDLLAKLRLRIENREEALNARRMEVEKIETTFETNKDTILKLQSEGPTMAQRYSMYQEMRFFIRNLLECLNDKVEELDSLIDKRRVLASSRALRLARRRRQDTKDMYSECVALAAGRPLSSVRKDNLASRAAEREARRSRRRRERESVLSGIAHEEGLSTDDEETTSQVVADTEALANIHAAANVLFVDAEEEYASLHKIFNRFVDWLSVDEKSFEDAYVSLCLPKISSAYVRIQLLSTDILVKPDFTISCMPWYVDAITTGLENFGVDSEHRFFVNLIPSIIEKVVIPFLTDVVREEWDPLSLKQTIRLSSVLSMLHLYPSITGKSKPMIALASAIKTNILTVIDEDLFVPMFSQQALDNSNTGCRMFLERQYWSGIKLLRCISKFGDVLSPDVRFELAVDGVVNRACALALAFGSISDVVTERKIRALMAELAPDLLSYGRKQSLQPLANCLTKAMEDLKSSGRSSCREIERYLDKFCL